MLYCYLPFGPSRTIYIILLFIIINKFNRQSKFIIKDRKDTLNELICLENELTNITKKRIKNIYIKA
jgi:hypothetical protein